VRQENDCALQRPPELKLLSHQIVPLSEWLEHQHYCFGTSRARPPQVTRSVSAQSTCFLAKRTLTAPPSLRLPEFAQLLVACRIGILVSPTSMPFPGPRQLVSYQAGETLCAVRICCRPPPRFGIPSAFVSGVARFSRDSIEVSDETSKDFLDASNDDRIRRGSVVGECCARSGV
jgi:hypothetical protein